MSLEWYVHHIDFAGHHSVLCGGNIAEEGGFRKGGGGTEGVRPPTFFFKN